MMRLGGFARFESVMWGRDSEEELPCIKVAGPAVGSWNLELEVIEGGVSTVVSTEQCEEREERKNLEKTVDGLRSGKLQERSITVTRHDLHEE